MSYVHLTTSQRVKIETYLKFLFSMRKIAQHLGRQPSTVSRGIKTESFHNAINAGRGVMICKKEIWIAHPWETARHMISRTDYYTVLSRTGTIVWNNLLMDIQMVHQDRFKYSLNIICFQFALEGWHVKLG